MKRVYSTRILNDYDYAQIQKCAEKFEQLCGSFGFKCEDAPYYANGYLSPISIHSVNGNFMYLPSIYGEPIGDTIEWYITMPAYESLDEEEYRELINAQARTLTFIQKLNNFDYSTLYHVNS